MRVEDITEEVVVTEEVQNERIDLESDQNPGWTAAARDGWATGRAGSGNPGAGTATRVPASRVRTGPQF
ncbi:hypothetical protein GXW82_16165 [Streptacidiphilus sp. 4-A2]|nr:hypothetical protein [Streptacidiphilus sp. 4-A2]